MTGIPHYLHHGGANPDWLRECDAMAADAEAPLEERPPADCAAFFETEAYELAERRDWPYDGSEFPAFLRPQAG